MGDACVGSDIEKIGKMIFKRSLSQRRPFFVSFLTPSIKLEANGYWKDYEDTN